jgi:hypothetical protein
VARAVEEGKIIIEVEMDVLLTDIFARALIIELTNWGRTTVNA